MAMGRRKRKLADRILALFLEEPAKERYGYEVCRETEAHAGRVYTILRRLEDEGILDSRWGHAPTPDMRPRRYYRLTTMGPRAPRAVAPASPGLPSTGPAALADLKPDTIPVVRDWRGAYSLCPRASRTLGQSVS